MSDVKFNSDWMNELLERVGVDASIRAVPGALVSPAFHAMFTAILDRQDALEKRIDDLQTQVNYPDGDPSYD